MSATPESVAATSPAEIAVTESQVPSAPLPGATILGYPRIGRDRELKRAVESFWKGNLSVDELKHAAADLRGATRSLHPLRPGSSGDRHPGGRAGPLP